LRYSRISRVKWYRPYDGRLAFEAHLQTPYFFLWFDATQNWVTAHRVSLLYRRG
jgi:quinol monooxygenase YgiN